MVSSAKVRHQSLRELAQTLSVIAEIHVIMGMKTKKLPLAPKLGHAPNCETIPFIHCEIQPEGLKLITKAV